MTCAGIAPPEFRVKQLIDNRYLSMGWFHDKLAKDKIVGPRQRDHQGAWTESYHWEHGDYDQTFPERQSC